MENITIISVLMIIIASVLGASGQIFFKIGTNPFSIMKLIIGGVLYVSALGLYLIGLRNLPLHVGYSIIALSYIWVIFFSKYILFEQITWLKISGSIGIVVSVLMIAL